MTITEESLNGWDKVMKKFFKKLLRNPQLKKPAYKPELEKLVYDFVDKLENKKILDKSLQRRILKNSIAWNKQEIMDDLIKAIKIFQDYGEEGVQFNFKLFLEKFRQKKLD